jgi:precorrin-6Y C5,15-methyltransferase (decarboxylating)
MKFIVIGITDNPQPWFPPEVQEIIKQGKVFSGGKRHHEIVAPLLPEGAEWIDITVPLDAVFEHFCCLSEEIAEHTIIVFASGDPLFFGFANTLKREFPEAEIQIYPTFNSLQTLAHRLLMPYHDMRIVSLTGRPWPEFDRALIERDEKIGVLTDKEHTPDAIAQRMLEYGYSDYTMYVGEHLGNPQLEKVSKLSLEEAARMTFTTPNCVILRPTPNPSRDGGEWLRGEIHVQVGNFPSLKGGVRGGPFSFGLPDSSFTLLNGREKMITKMPIRLLTLQALDFPSRHVFWDIGFCTGSVSIEARLLFPHLDIHSFEIRPECEAIIQENARKFGALGINVHIGDFLETEISSLPRPDSVFIGGHGGYLKAIMMKVLRVLAPDGIIVMNSVKAPKVTTDSHQLWDEACQELGLQQESPTKIILNDNHPIEILKAHQ